MEEKQLGPLEHDGCLCVLSTTQFLNDFQSCMKGNKCPCLCGINVLKFNKGSVGNVGEVMVKMTALLKNKFALFAKGDTKDMSVPIMMDQGQMMKFSAL